MILLLFSCKPAEDIVATRVTANDAGEDGSLDSTTDSATDSMADSSSDVENDTSDGEVDECTKKGPEIPVGDNSLSDTQCASGTPSLAFEHALCICRGYSASEQLITDSYDSSTGEMVFDKSNASVGINAEIGVEKDPNEPGFTLDIGGSLQTTQITSASPLTPPFTTIVAGDLLVKGKILGRSAALLVSGAASVGDDIEIDVFSVAKDLTVPEGIAILVPPETYDVGGEIRAPVQWRPPCGCAESDIVDISSLVEQHREDNDNDMLAEPLSDLEDFPGPLTRELPCGHFFLDRMRMTGTGLLTLVIKGRVALYVSGQVSFEGPVQIKLEKGAELNLFLAGMLGVIQGDLTFGTASIDSRVRLYIGGTKIELKGKKNLFSGHIYAPHAELTLEPDTETEVFGSVFIDRLAQSGGRLTIHRDTNPIESGRSCAE